MLAPEATTCPCCQGPLVEIGIFATLFYVVLRFLWGTRGSTLLNGTFARTPHWYSTCPIRQCLPAGR